MANRWGNNGNSEKRIFLGSKISADGDFSHEIKMLDPWKKSYDKHAAVAAAAKSLRSCLTLCDPVDGSPPGSSVPGILQARTLEWVARIHTRDLQLGKRASILISILKIRNGHTSVIVI